MKHRVADLDGALLDVAVALAEGWEEDRPQDHQMKKHGVVHGCGYYNGYSYAIVAPRPKDGMHFGCTPHWSPSTMWDIAGPLIERERITVSNPNGDQGWVGTVAYPKPPKRNGTPQWGHVWECGPTPLVAAMRCFVVSVFGDEVKLPDTDATE